MMSVHLAQLESFQWIACTKTMRHWFQPLGGSYVTKILGQVWDQSFVQQYCNIFCDQNIDAYCDHDRTKCMQTYFFCSSVSKIQRWLCARRPTLNLVLETRLPGKVDLRQQLIRSTSLAWQMNGHMVAQELCDGWRRLSTLLIFVTHGVGLLLQRSHQRTRSSWSTC